MGGGTDATRVASYNPFVSLYWLVTGRTIGGLVMYDDRNRLDRAEALRLWTVGNSWFSSENGAKGAIVEGQVADLAVLSADYFSVPDEETKRLESVMTIVGGGWSMLRKSSRDSRHPFLRCCPTGPRLQSTAGMPKPQGPTCRFIPDPVTWLTAFINARISAPQWLRLPLLGLLGDTMFIHRQTCFAVVLLSSVAGMVSGATPEVAVGPQYDSAHVYVAPADFDRFVSSLVTTFGGTTTKQGVFTVTPTPSSTMSQLVLTPAGSLSVFGFKTPIPYPFGAE